MGDWRQKKKKVYKDTLRISKRKKKKGPRHTDLEQTPPECSIDSIPTSSRPPFPCPCDLLQCPMLSNRTKMWVSHEFYIF